jgi:photosystem II stability/assembly factor-like uncharacterized protein
MNSTCSPAIWLSGRQLLHNGSVFAVRTTGVVESKDNGRTWSAAEIAGRLPKSLPITSAQNAPPDRRQRNLWVYQMEFPQSDPLSAFLVTNGGLFITHDNGKNWCLATFGSDVLNTVASVAFADESGFHVLAITVDYSGPALWRSQDGGRSFQRVHVGG